MYSRMYRLPCLLGRRKQANTSCCLTERSFATASKQKGGGGYQSIGSFHNDNLADTLAQDESTYQAPSLPFEDEIASTPFSPLSDARDDFSLDLDSWTFLNHAAFGGALKVGQDRAEMWRRHLEEQPLRYHDRELLPHLAHSARALAKLLVGPQLMESSSSSYALLPNVTSGMNAVLSNYTQKYGKEGHIICWDSTYGSVKTMARHYGRQGRITEIPLLAEYLTPKYVEEESSAAHVLTHALTQRVAPQNPQRPPPLLLLEQTASNTALNFPLADLAKAARTHLHPETLVVVDGAHGLWAQDTAHILHDANGQDGDSSVDVYLANGHKWLAAPRGVALVWSRNDASTERLLKYPAVLSHGMHAPDSFSRFVWDGCRDYNAALAIPPVLEYWNTRADDGSTRLTEDRSEVRRRLWEGLALLAQQWHGMPKDMNALQKEGFRRGLLLAPHEEWLNAPMTLLRLPHYLEKPGNTSDDAKRIQDFLYDNFVEVPIKCIEGKLYVRLSCYVYNRQEDFARLGNVLNKRSA